MSLSKEQISTLLGMISSAEPSKLDCDECFEQVAEFAEVVLSHKEIPDALKAVESHLKQCICCKDEFNALMDGLRTLEVQ